MTESLSVNPPWSPSQSSIAPDIFKQLADRLDVLSPSPEPEFFAEASPRPVIVAAARSTQPTVEELAAFGIKVKDFGLAGANPLPPIAPYRRRLVQGPDGEFVLAGGRDAPPGKVIQRQDTEPIRRESATFRRGGTFLDLNSQESDYSYGSQSQPPLVRSLESQESDGPATPLVTPHGSMQDIEDTSLVPASQLDDSQLDNAQEPMSYSQLGFSQPAELSSQPPTPVIHTQSIQAMPSPRTSKRPGPKSEDKDKRPVPLATNSLSSLSSLSSSTSSLTPPPSPKPESKRPTLRKQPSKTVLSPTFQFPAPSKTTKAKLNSVVAAENQAARYQFRKRLAPAIPEEVQKPPKKAKTTKMPPPPVPPTRTKTNTTTTTRTRAQTRLPTKPEPQPPPERTMTTRSRHKRNAARDLGVC